MTATIQHLKKVTLALSAGSEPGKFNLSSSPVDFEFIYGVASYGLCPFESALADKRPGDILTINVSTNEGHEYFGHFFPSLRKTLGIQIMPVMLSLQIEVSRVIDAEAREVVQSLAKALSHGGCGGSCDCGCG